MFGHVSWGQKFTATVSYQKVSQLVANSGWIGVQLFL